MEEFNYIDNYLNTTEPVIFEASTPVNKKHTEDFFIFHFTRHSPAIALIGFITAVICIICGIKDLAFGNIFNAVTYFIEAAVLVSIPFILIKVMVAKTSKAPYYYMNTNGYKFFNDYYVNTDLFSITVIPYSMLVSAHENKDYFFLYLTDQQAHVIPKRSFILNTPEEMRDFLYYKLGERFIVNCKQ